MGTISKILLTTDFSDVSGQAFPLAKELARLFKAKLTILHILEEDLIAGFPMLVGYAQPEMIDISRFREEARKRAKKGMENLEREFRNDGVDVHTLIRPGTKPFVDIVKTARELPADLIVMATHGRSGLRHALVGSTAERVVRKASCPVLTIKPEGHEYTAP